MFTMDEATKNAEVVKKLHKTLRNKVKKGYHPDEVWGNLLEDSDVLSEYSKAMSLLALQYWPKDTSQSRIKWAYNVCLEYFYNSGAYKSAQKYFKQQMYRSLEKNIVTEYEKLTIESELRNFERDWKSLITEKIVLLDVGSCFNGFKEFKEFLVFPIDIAPATQDVYKLDFLNVVFKEVSQSFTSDQFTLVSCIRDNLTDSSLPKAVFDVVVFSLLLCYLPCPEQRLKCCINAHISLRLYGLLIIITPDSSHQNRNAKMMASWKNALEGIGFVRYKYTKLEHLHCMAFFKANETNILLWEKYTRFLFIPQDFQEINEEKVNMNCSEVKFSSNHNIEELIQVCNLSEL
ncbi:S-adenosylmethionine sensor upstream of mTORC1 [Hydra vulgaris]|uniref:S-adenosylmethionine sensor upstream of mTORC1 n=1 Tax=Hydra vulgaris TaxID=6087 RepID=UPI0032EA5177